MVFSKAVKLCNIFAQANVLKNFCNRLTTQDEKFFKLVHECVRKCLKNQNNLNQFSNPIDLYKFVVSQREITKIDYYVIKFITMSLFNIPQSIHINLTNKN